MPDLKIVCKQCGYEFNFTENEQGYFFQRDLAQPKRCRKCRKSLSRGEFPRRSEKQNPDSEKAIYIDYSRKKSSSSPFGEVVYDGREWFIDQERIQDFVDAVEAKKGFKPHYEKIFRHMVSEIGELENAIWNWENLLKSPLDIDMKKTSIGMELVDLISLCVYMATVMRIDLNEMFPVRMKAIAEQYGVTV